MVIISITVAAIVVAAAFFISNSSTTLVPGSSLQSKLKQDQTANQSAYHKAPVNANITITNSLMANDTLVISSQALSILPKTGVYVPLYIYPTSPYWDAVINAKLAHPSVPIVVTINPSSGVGSSKHSDYVNGVNRLKSAGIVVLGYVYTKYGARSVSSIESEITAYKNWYNVDGIMLDEMSARIGHEQYYKNLTAYAKAMGMKFVKGNPGRDVPQSYIGTVDNISIYENADMHGRLNLPGWYSNFDKRNFSFIIYGAPSLNSTLVANATHDVGLMYITNGIPPNPYDTIPPYFEDLVAALDVKEKFR